MPTEREALRLRDIIEHIDRIEQYVAGMDLAAFAADQRTIDAVERCLLRLSEAVIWQTLHASLPELRNDCLRAL